MNDFMAAECKRRCENNPRERIKRRRKRKIKRKNEREPVKMKYRRLLGGSSSL
jgi:hypothetical protein